MDVINSKYNITPDTILWNDFRTGDEKSFEKIYRIYVQPLYKYGSKFTYDKELVLDCIQEVFVDLFIYRQNLGETNNIRLYLFKSLKRKIIRSNQNNNLIQLFPDDELPFLSHYSSEQEIPDLEDETGRIYELTKALKMLSPRQKEAIYLRFVCELSYEEICHVLNLNYQSVRNLVHRAIEKLRKILVCSSSFLLLFL
jgi:RNA polymerase sigma factor (sigma-70 family)